MQNATYDGCHSPPTKMLNE